MLSITAFTTKVKDKVNAFPINENVAIFQSLKYKK